MKFDTEVAAVAPGYRVARLGENVRVLKIRAERALPCRQGDWLITLCVDHARSRGARPARTDADIAEAVPRPTDTVCSRLSETAGRQPNRSCSTRRPRPSMRRSRISQTVGSCRIRLSNQQMRANDECSARDRGCIVHAEPSDRAADPGKGLVLVARGRTEFVRNRLGLVVQQAADDDFGEFTLQEILISRRVPHASNLRRSVWILGLAPTTPPTSIARAVYL